MEVGNFSVFLGDPEKGTWSVDFIYTDESGKQHRRKITTGTTDKRLASKLAPELIANYKTRSRKKNTKVQAQLQARETNHPKPTPDSRLSYVAEYFMSLYAGKMESKTKGLIKSSFSSLIKYISDLRIREIDTLDVTQWQSGFLKDRSEVLGKQVSTTRGLSTYHRMIQARFNDLIRAKILTENPFKGLKPKELKRDPRGRAWTQEEIDIILTVADKMTKPKDRRKQSTVLPLLPHFIRFGISTGLRTDELCNLRWEQIRNDPSDNKIKIFFWENETKTDIAGTVTLSTRARGLLQEIRNHYDERRIDNNLDPSRDPFIYNAVMSFPNEEPKEAVRRYLIRMFGETHGLITFWEMTKGRGAMYVFEHGNGLPWTPSVVAHNFRKVIKRTELKPDGAKRFSPYETRHTFAVLALKKGMAITEVQSTLRHQDISLTSLYGTTNKVEMVEMEV